MRTYDILAEAIRNKRPITAVYRGLPRELCPHALGLKNGNFHLLAYQSGGRSSRPLGPVGSHDNWRCMDLSELRSVSVAEGRWCTANNHSRPNTCMDVVHVEVTWGRAA